jgi:hypothetical protein
MQGHIDTVNFRTGNHRHFYGETWKLNDGPTFLGWQTVVPIKRDEHLVPMASKPLTEEQANLAAMIVRDAETWEAARKGIEETFPYGFPGMTYRS